MTSPLAKESRRSDCSDVEWQARVDLAALYRLTAHYGMSDLDNGAIGARVPDQPDHYLTHPYGIFWEEVRASDIIKVGPDGMPSEPNAPWLNDGAVNLCRWIFETRPEINFFVHGHEEEVMAVGSTKEGLLPLNQPAVYLGHILDYLDYEFHEDEEFAQTFRTALADNLILISRNHGYYSLGDTAAAAFFRAYFLRQTCSTQIKTLSMGQTLHVMDPQKVARYRDQMYESEHYNYDGKTEWPGLIRLLDRGQAEYRE